MRIAIVILSLFGSISASAETVTIDFSDVTHGFGIPVIETKGFRLTTPQLGFVVADNLYLGVTNTSIGLTGNGNAIELMGDGSFSLESWLWTANQYIDPFEPSPEVNVTGYYASGGQISVTIELYSSSGVVFSDDWQGLKSVQIDSDVLVYMDDIVTNVIPIPAAAWLLGSALAGLGLMRRKQIV